MAEIQIPETISQALATKIIRGKIIQVKATVIKITKTRAAKIRETKTTRTRETLEEIMPTGILKTAITGKDATGITVITAVGTGETETGTTVISVTGITATTAITVTVTGKNQQKPHLYGEVFLFLKELADLKTSSRYSLYLRLMEAIQISGIFKDAICRAQAIEPDLYRITMDTVFIGIILKENGGWCLQEVAGEELTAENVQLIGAYLDRNAVKLLNFHR